MLKAGVIAPVTMAWKDGLENWVKVSSFLQGDEPEKPRSPLPSSKKQNISGISQLLLGEYSRSSLQEGEIPVHYARTHWSIFVWPGILLLMSMLSLSDGALNSIFFAFVIVLFIRAIIIYTTNEFTVTDRRLITKSGFIRKYTHENFISKIESVVVSQGFFERLFGSGTVVVTGAGGSPQVFKNIASPFSLRSSIQKVQSALSRANGV